MYSEEKKQKKLSHYQQAVTTGLAPTTDLEGFTK